MEKRERLLAAIRGDQTDRPPTALWRFWPGDDQRPEDLAAAHIAFQQAYDWDFVVVRPSAFYMGRDWGLADTWEGAADGIRRITDRVIEAPEDWLTMKVLEPGEGMLGQQLDALTLMQASFKEHVPFIQTIYSPMALACALAGNRTLIRHMRQNAGQIHHAFQTISDSTIRFMQETKKRGVAGFMYVIRMANHDQISEAEYEVFGRPYDLQVLAATRDLWFNVVSLQGRYSMFKQVADYPVQALNWMDRDSGPRLEDGLREIRGAAMGGISTAALLHEDPSLAVKQVEEAMQVTGGKRLIIGAESAIHVTTPSGNILKLRQAVEKLAK